MRNIRKGKNGQSRQGRENCLDSVYILQPVSDQVAISEQVPESAMDLPELQHEPGRLQDKLA